ncbi:hypothetical protein ACQPZQ_02420 [Pseudonocardia sp. CA-142604]
MSDEGELAQPEPVIDLEHPDPERRLTLEQSLKLIEARYDRAIELLGKL